MMVKLRTKSQITLPKAILSKLGLAEGDQFDVFERDGVIHLVPIAVYPKQYVYALKKEVAAVRPHLREGTQPTFSNTEAMLDSLEQR